jgi:glutamate-1-semialdehyde 2,1-aminomutase
MLEPAAPVEGLNGPVRDADPAFLRAIAAHARQAGALLIFDEVFTGFRYRGGSVQRATGVTPDLTCLGKALSGGMPLAALVGRRGLFESAMARIYYGPTFKGEVYSFAAARASLLLFRRLDVPARIARFGERLRSGVDERCRRFGIPAGLSGPPFRMVLSFRESDPERLVQLRTLAHQELVKAGVLTYRGFLLPSLAHDDSALQETLKAFDRALEVVARASNGPHALARYLDIPLLA